MTLVRMYLLAHVLITLVALLLFMLRRGSAQLGRPMSYRQQLQLGYLLVFVALVAPLLAISAPRAELLPMTSQVWSATSMEALGATAGMQDAAHISAGGSGTGMSVAVLAQFLLYLVLVGLAFCLARILTGYRAAARILQRAHLVRRSGAIQLLASDEARVPFSCWAPRACYIVVPAALIARPEEFRIALRHEGQHHRQGDTRVLYAMELLRGAFFLNPAVHVLLRQLCGLQEFACDEAVVGRQRVTAKVYCDCLVAAAADAARTPYLPACLQMAGAAGASQLARRIRAVLDKPRHYLQRGAALAVNATAAIAILASGVVLSASIDDRRVSLPQAREMAAVAESQGAMPLQVDDKVLSELNRLVGTPDGRAFTRSALQRMAEHEPMITAQLRQHGLPAALLAVPLVESGYRNLQQGPNARHGAGIWMFIKPTARRFGLEVEPGRDQRLDISAETTAAMQMFASLYAEFGDWGFTLLAFNGGNALVHRAIRETGATSALAAASLGYENDPNYVARVMAAIIVLHNTRRLDLQD